ncbi:MAG: hypothetical protein L3J03_06040 [Desulfobacterales bacterium]|nr:hypothetical protein [Desulfobacterales bacterium]
MKTVCRLGLLALFLGALLVNCTLYGSMARIPGIGDLFVSHISRQNDLPGLLYIKGGLALTEIRLFRKLGTDLGKRAVRNLGRKLSEPGGITPGQAFDLTTRTTRVLYWLPLICLGLLGLTFIRPRGRRRRRGMR